MSLVVAEGVGKCYDAGFVLRDVSFRLSPADRVALVGANGEGKTTLLRLLAGELAPTTGTIQTRRNLRVGHLPQDPPALGAATLWQSMLSVFADLRRIEADLHALAERLAGDSPAGGDLVERYGRLQERFEAQGGYDYETRIETVLTGLGFPAERYHAPLAHFSGGQRSRAMLARLILEEPDLLLLDEPTNHLDLEAVEWLERWLLSLRSAIVVVSHDRYFLDRIARRTWEVAFGAMEEYKGNYTAYLAQSRQRLEQRLRTWKGRQEHVARTEEFIRRTIAGQKTKQAQARRKQLERFSRSEAIDRPREHRRLHIRLRPARRSGDIVFRVANLAAGYEPGKPVLRVPRLEVRRGDRVAVVGANGTGKTTLLRTLLGRLAPLEGTVKRGASVVPGYMSQTQEDIDRSQTALAAVMAARSGMTPHQGRTLLGGFGFSGDDVDQPVGELSGGQRSRIVLARLSAIGANVLLLDEPTNHLDLPSRDVFQEALRDFAGTVLSVSHDRYMIQALADEIWAIEDGGVHRIRGGWEDYVTWRAARSEAARQPQGAAGRAAARRKDGYVEAKRRKRRSQRMERRRQQLEEQIHRLEAELSELTEAISRAGQDGDVDRVRQLGDHFRRKDEQRSDLWAEWEALVGDLEA
jgi:ATP-binding cassette subfamily F protein 3